MDYHLRVPKYTNDEDDEARMMHVEPLPSPLRSSNGFGIEEHNGRATTATKKKDDEKKFPWKVRVLLLLLLVGILWTFVVGSRDSFSDVDPRDAIVVTGASSGIGKHAALSLVKEGYTVFAGIRKVEDGEALVRSARRFHLDTDLLKPILLDVTNPDHIQSAVKDVTDFVGPEYGLKGLFNNAGVFMVKGKGNKNGGNDVVDSTSVEHLDLSVYQTTMDVNYFGTVRMTQAFLPLLRKYPGGAGAGAGGRRGSSRIVFNTSIAGMFGIPFVSPYVSSKHALEGFADSLRRELYHLDNVDVSILEPGYIVTPIFQRPTIPTSVEPYVQAERRAMNVNYKSCYYCHND